MIDARRTRDILYTELRRLELLRQLLVDELLAIGGEVGLRRGGGSVPSGDREGRKDQ